MEERVGEQPQTGWELRQLRLWEEQIKESGTYGKSSEHKDHAVRFAVPPEAVAEIIINRTAGHLSAGEVHQRQATRTLSRQEQQENAGMLSSASKPDVETDPRHKLKNSERKNKHGVGDGKMWRQNLFNKYAKQWNRSQKDRIMEINYSENRAGNSTIRELEGDVASDSGSPVENADQQKESEMQYLTALRQLATSLTPEKEERSTEHQLQKKGDKKPEIDKNSKNALGPSRNHGTKGITIFGTQGSQKPSQDSNHLLETAATCRILATMRSTKESGGEQNVTKDARVKGGQDKRQERAVEVLKRIDVKPCDHQAKDGQSNSNWSDSLPRKQVPKGSATVIQDGSIILQNSENSKRLEELKPDNYWACISSNVPLKEKGNAERILKRATARSGGDITIPECEFPKKSEGLESKGRSEHRDISSRPSDRPSRKEGKKQTEGSQELCGAQDLKGHKSMIHREGRVKDSSVQSESGSCHHKDDKFGRPPQQWGRVDWAVCDSKRPRTPAAALRLQQEKPRNATLAFKETKLRPFLQPQYRTIYRVKDSHCEEVREDAA